MTKAAAIVFLSLAAANIAVTLFGVIPAQHQQGSQR